MNHKIESLRTLLLSKRGEMKKSRFKIWLRAFLLVQFSVIFSIYFFRDIAAGYFMERNFPMAVARFTSIHKLIHNIIYMYRHGLCLEAMAAGLPVMTSNRGAMAMMNSETGSTTLVR